MKVIVWFSGRLIWFFPCRWETKIDLQYDRQNYLLEEPSLFWIFASGALGLDSRIQKYQGILHKIGSAEEYFKQLTEQLEKKGRWAVKTVREEEEFMVRQKLIPHKHISQINLRWCEESLPVHTVLSDQFRSLAKRGHFWKESFVRRMQLEGSYSWVRIQIWRR